MDRLGRMCAVVRCDSSVIDPERNIQCVTRRNFDKKCRRKMVLQRVLKEEVLVRRK